MADLERVAFPGERIREHVRLALRGIRSEWPALTAEESANLVAHGIAPLIYSVTAAPELRHHAIAAAAGESLRLADLRQVVDALATAGVPVLLIKGSALAYDVYASPELRPRGDTDLLVPPQAFDTAREVLRAIGLSEQVTSGDEHGVRQATFTRRGPFAAPHVYDLHFSALNSPVADAAFSFDAHASRPLRSIGTGAATLPRVESLMLACLHRVVHHYDDERLIWLVDIALLRRAMTDEEHARFWRLAATHEVVAICRRSIDLADEWAGESGPPVTQFLDADELSRRERSAVFLDPEVTYGRVMLANFSALSWRARATRLWQLAFPPAEFMRASFPRASRGSLPLLYLFRAGRGIVRLFRRERGR